MRNFLFVDDHSIVRAGLMTIVASEFPDAEFFEAENEKQASSLIDKQKFSLIILDLNMPDSDSGRLLQYAQKVQPQTPILIVTMYDEINFATRYFKLGIKGFINKSTEAGETLRAIKVILDGGKYISDKLKVSILKSHLKTTKDNPFDKLSEREFQVIHGLIAGKNIREVANNLSINVSTVSTYKGKAFEKLGIPVSGFVELVSLARLYNIAPQ